MNKSIFKWVAVAAVVVFSGNAAADADDDAWIAKCVRENNKGAAPDVVKKYCSCMNGKMDDNERKSISNWERTHPDEMKACEKEAGWN